MTSREAPFEKTAQMDLGSSSAASAKDRFLDLLNNRSKLRPEWKSQARESGFLCLVRAEGLPAPSLKGLQALCHSSEQQWNDCYSLRYRIADSMGFGTLVFAFLSDLSELAKSSPELEKIYSDFSPKEIEPEITDSASWRDITSLIQDFLHTYERNLQIILENGLVDKENIDSMIQIFETDGVLETGKRLVVFCEFEEAAEPTAWDQVLAYLSGRLPERFGLVLSGLPEGLAFQTDGIAAEEIRFTADDPLIRRQDEGEAPKTQLYEIAGLSSDRPAGSDQLGVRHYAQSLAQFILHPDTQPLTVGVHGPWGKGKSSFMGFIEQDLVREVCGSAAPKALSNHDALEQELMQTKASLERTQTALRSSEEGDAETLAALRAKATDLQREVRTLSLTRDSAWRGLVKRAESGVVCVTFNAWRFQDSEQIWAGLASVIIERFEASLSWLERMRLRWSYLWRARRTEAWRAAIEVGLAITLALILLLWLGSGAAETLAGMDDTSKVLLYLSSLFGPFLLVAWRLHGVIRPLGQRVLEYAQLPDYREQRGFQHKVLDDIRAVADSLRAFKRAEPKVVIFIDDLDRCSDDKIMEILQAINLVLAESRFFVVMGVDTAMLFRAIQTHYRQAHGSAPEPEAFARRYLRKIIQLSFHLPDAPEAQRTAFIESLFSLAARGLGEEKAPPPPSEDATDLPPLPVDLGALRETDPVPLEQVTDTPAELQAFKDFADFIEDNARETKRLVNVHRLIKILLQEASEGWSEERQRRLVRWLVFCSSWPGLIDEALADAKARSDAADIFQDGGEPAAWCRHDPRLARFAQEPEQAPVPASALTSDRALYQAAKIAEMVQDSPGLVEAKE